MTNFTPILYNNTPNFGQVCELNQINMMNALEKMPYNIYIFFLLAFISLLEYLFVVPYLKDSWKEPAKHSLVIFSISMLVFGLLYLTAITFNIDSDGWKHISYYVGGVAALLILLYLFINGESLFRWIRGNLE